MPKIFRPLKGILLLMGASSNVKWGGGRKVERGVENLSQAVTFKSGCDVVQMTSAMELISVGCEITLDSE